MDEFGAVTTEEFSGLNIIIDSFFQPKKLRKI